MQKIYLLFYVSLFIFDYQPIIMQNQPIITAALADDHQLFRQSLVQLLQQTCNVRVDIQASNGKELIEQLDTTAQLPDICLLDISMPVMNGHETMKNIHNKWPELKVIVVTMYGSAPNVLSMIENGASGFVLKGNSVDTLAQTITAIYNNNLYFPNYTDKDIIRILQRNKKEKVTLTERETEFARLCCSDKSMEDIAADMHISKRTAETYRDAILRKINGHNRTAIVLYAIQTGIVLL